MFKKKRIYGADIEKMQVRGTDGKLYHAEVDKYGRILLTGLIEDSPPKGSPKAPPPPPKSLLEKSAEEEEKKKLKARQKEAGGTKASKKKPNKGRNEPENVPKLDDTVFRSRLSSIMTDNKYDRRLRGRTRGKLDMTRLYKVPAKSTSVFTQKLTRKNKEYNVILLVDVSGSMYGERATNAAEATVFLAKSMVGINVNLQVVLFNHWLWTVKEFDEKADYKKMYNEVKNSPDGTGGGCNHDFSAMYEAYKMFRGRAGKNILIMMSDGEPAPCYTSSLASKKMQVYKDKVTEWFSKKHEEDETSPHYYTEGNNKVMPLADVGLTNDQRREKKHFHHLVKSNRDVSSIALGIQSQSWQMPDNVTVDNLDEMKSGLLKILNKKIKRG